MDKNIDIELLRQKAKQFNNPIQATPDKSLIIKKREMLKTKIDIKPNDCWQYNSVKLLAYLDKYFKTLNFKQARKWLDINCIAVGNYENDNNDYITIMLKTADTEDWIKQNKAYLKRLIEMCDLYKAEVWFWIKETQTIYWYYLPTSAKADSSVKLDEVTVSKT
jgi:hypothetical protein